MGELDTKINLLGIEIDNPIIPASGTYGYGYEFAELYDINMLGTFSFKGTTAEPRFGNPTPRIAECPAGMINCIGLQNPGIEKVISEELPKLAKVFHKPVMANISGFSLEEYVSNCEKIDKVDMVGWIELNVSCPNVHGGGLAFGTDPDNVRNVVKAVKNNSKDMKNRTCVMLDNDATIDFDKDGNWMIVDCRKDGVPMRMVPGKIQMYLSKSNPGADVVYMGREIKNGDITIILDDGTELHFTNEHTIIK